MKLKLIALATMLAVSGVANAKIADSNDNNVAGSSTPGDLFASVFSDGLHQSYTVDLGVRLDQFTSSVAPTQLGVNLVWDLNGGANGTGSFSDMSLVSTGLAAHMVALNYGSVYNTFATSAVLGATDLRFDVKAMDGTPANGSIVGQNRYLSTSSANMVTASNSQVFNMDFVDTHPVALNADTTNSTHSTNAAGAGMFDAGDAQNVEFYNGSKDNWQGAVSFSSPDVVGNELNFFLLSNTSQNAGLQASVTKYAGVWKFDTATAQLSYVSAVPEAETYAMMLAGLGLVGFMARRRRAV